MLLAPYDTRMIVTASGSSHWGSVAYLLARLAAGCGDNAAADELFADAARRDEHAGAAALVVRDLQRHGELLHAADRHQHADRSDPPARTARPTSSGMCMSTTIRRDEPRVRARQRQQA